MKIELSPIDRLFLGSDSYPIEMSFFFPCNLDGAALQAALDRLCESWAPLTGAVRIDGESAFIESAKHRLTVVESTSMQLPTPDSTRGYENLQTGIRTEVGEPLLKLRVLHGERFSWLTVALAHCLGDGYSYFLFLRNLSLVARGEPPMELRWDRAPLFARPDAPAFDGERPYLLGEPRSRFSSAARTWQIDRFDRETARAKLAEAQAETAYRLSHHDWISAHCWKRETAKTDVASLLFNTPVDFRRYFKDTLGGSFFGNAVYFATTRATRDEVQNSSLGALAARTRESVRKISDEAIAAQIAMFARDLAEHGVKGAERFNAFQAVSPVLVTNLSALPLGELRLGPQGEAPLSVRYVSTYPGLTVVLPSQDGEIAMQRQAD